ncbi:hypothetical protein RIF29_17752 [Crotalaria pallida]|uniref:OTU1-like C-terminal C2H2-type zinc finger domain-containing protein n=1 Tax=Crotalaria pallida TaxID=3830 RepID=A0AAN9IFL1_CROPI
MAGVSLKCGDCGALLKSVEEAQEHAELTSYSNFSESTEAVLNLVCTSCSKPCRSKTVRSLPFLPFFLQFPPSLFAYLIIIHHSFDSISASLIMIHMPIQFSF